MFVTPRARVARVTAHRRRVRGFDYRVPEVRLFFSGSRVLTSGLDFAVHRFALALKLDKLRIST